jgi:hypothetical protein
MNTPDVFRYVEIKEVKNEKSDFGNKSRNDTDLQ